MLDIDCVSEIFNKITNFNDHINLSLVNKYFNHISYAHIQTIPYDVCEKLIKIDKFDSVINKYNRIGYLNLIGTGINNITNVANKCEKIHISKYDNISNIPDNVIVSDKIYHKIIDVDNNDNDNDNDNTFNIYKNNLYDRSKSYSLFEGELYDKYRAHIMFRDYIKHHVSNNLSFVITTVGSNTCMYATIKKYIETYECSIIGGGYAYEFKL